VAGGVEVHSREVVVVEVVKVVWQQPSFFLALEAWLMVIMRMRGKRLINAPVYPFYAI
jgi:hypothetical protein